MKLAIIFVSLLFLGGFWGSPSLLADDQDLRIELNVDQTGEVFGTRSDYAITHSDLDRFALSIPEEHRAGTLASRDRLSRIIDNLSIRVGLSQRAVSNGLAQSEEVQSELFQVLTMALSEIYISNQQSAEALDDYTNSAEELYLNDPMLFTRDDESVTFKQVLITPSEGMVPSMEQILEAFERISGGETFSQVALELSDDPTVEENEGLYSDVLLSQLDEVISSVVSNLDVEELSDPFQSQYGWHVIQLIERSAPNEPTWEEVKALYLEEARIRHAGDVRDELLADVLDGSFNTSDEEIRKFLMRHGALDAVAE